MDKEKRLDRVRYYLLKGETGPIRIQRMINQDHDTNIQSKTIKSDIAEIRQRNTDYMDALASGDIELRLKFYDDILIENIAIMQTAIRDLTHDPAKNAYRLSQIIPQLNQTIEQQLNMTEKWTLFRQNARLHAKLTSQIEGAKSDYPEEQHIDQKDKPALEN